MIKKIIKLIAGILAIGISGLVYAQVEVPHTFQPGQPARAAEVNENFDALATAVNQNAAELRANVLDFSDPEMEITTPGYYVLDRDWSDPGLTLIISGDRVTIDLRGYSLGDGYQTIDITGDDVTVRDGSLIGDIPVTTTGYGSLFENLRVSGRSGGMVLGGIDLVGTDRYPIGGGAKVRNSTVNSSSGLAIVIQSAAVVVERNSISGREGSIRINSLFAPDQRRWLIDVSDNRIHCSGVRTNSCIVNNLRGNRFSGNTIVGFSETNTSPVMAIMSSQNQIINNTFTRSVANYELPAFGSAIQISGDENVIRGTYTSAVTFNYGIIFTQDWNYYGDNIVSAMIEDYDLGTTTQRDMGGNF